MSTPATAKAAPQPASATPAPAAAQNISTVRAQKLRDAQVRKITPERMQSFGYHANLPDPQQVMIPASWDIEDVLTPECWTFIAPKMQSNPSASVMHDRLGAVFHVHTEDHAFYAVLYLHSLVRNAQGQAHALKVTCIGPACDPSTGKACPVDVKTGLPWKGRKPMTQKAD
jgi:hypothetical protein